MHKTIARLLETAVEKYSDKPYLRKKTDAGWEEISFAQANDSVMAFAAWLLQQGFKKTETISLIAEGCPQWVLAELGMTMAGIISVPLSIKLLPEELPFRLDHSGSRAVMVTKNTLEKAVNILDKIKDKNLTLIYLDDDTDHPEKILKDRGFSNPVLGFYKAIDEGTAILKNDPSLAAKLKSAVAEDDVINICYTSGTTGNPKGIMLTNKNYFVNVDDAVNLFNIPVGYKLLVILPLDHSFAHTVAIYAGLSRALQLSFVDARGGNMAILRNIPVNMKEVEPNMLLTVPALTSNFMKKIIQGVEEKGGFISALFHAGIKAGIKRFGNGYTNTGFFTKLTTFFPYAIAKALIFKKVISSVFGKDIRFCVGGGALLELKQQEFFNALGLPIYQGYGLTEAAPIISTNTPKKHKFGTSGLVFPSLELKIMKDGQILKTGEKGEIVIRGGNVMKGYFRNPEQTEKTIIDNWLFTGDLAYMDKDNFLVVVGREKALLIAADGEKYPPEEIEEAITADTNLISQIMVYNDQRKYTSALIVLDPDNMKKLITQGTKPEVALEIVISQFQKYKATATIPVQWCPATFLILEEPFTEQNLMINSTMKMVRHKITAAYAKEIEYMYSTEGSRPQNPENLKTISKFL